MALDAHRLAQFAADALERLERDERLPARDPELVDAQLIVEVSGSSEDGEAVSFVRGFVMSGREMSGVGLLLGALEIALRRDQD